jgi:hypothetical protein
MSKFKFLFCFIIISTNLHAFEPGLKELQDRCLSIERGNEDEMLFLRGKSISNVSLSNKNCQELNGAYTGSYYEKFGKLYGKVIFNLDCGVENGYSTIEVLTKERTRKFEFKLNSLSASADHRSIFINSPDIVGRFDINHSEPLKKLYFRTKKGEAFLMHVNKNKTNMPTPKTDS